MVKSVLGNEFSISEKFLSEYNFIQVADNYQMRSFVQTTHRMNVGAGTRD